METTRRWAGLMALLAATCLAQSPAAAKPAAAAKGPGSISGTWFNMAFSTVFKADEGLGGTETGGAGEIPPLKPWAAALVAQRTQDAKEGHPYAFTKSRCLPAGMPSSMFTPPQLPLQILETPGQVTILFEEFSVFRVIKLNAKHAEDPDPNFMGDSVGHWEGDTLVVDTIGLTKETTLRGIIPHSEKLHLVERIRRAGPHRLDIEIKADDPDTFDGVMTQKAQRQLLPGVPLREYICINDRNRPDGTGRTGVQLSGGG